MIGRVRLDPVSLDNAAANARALGELFQECSRAATAISLVEIEPASSRGRAQGVADRASALVGRAATSAGSQAPLLRRRAAAARKADAGGGAFQGVLGIAGPVEKVTMLLVDARKRVRNDIVKRAESERLARKKLKHARTLWENEKWRQKRWSSPEAMKRELRMTPSQIREIEQKTRWMERHKTVIRRIPPSIRRNPLLNSPLIKNPVTRRLPVIGVGAGTAIDIAKGDSVPDALAKGAAGAAGGAAGAVVAGGLCGMAAAATLGGAAPFCPFVIGAGGALGSVGGGLAYDGAKGLVDRIRGKKPVVKLIPPPKKIEIKVPKLTTTPPPKTGKASEV